jgi:NAD(P)-dependent dehydrogenase (short-subunit alcohol dehydrogenase family)
MSFENKVAVVTGAAQGMGAAYARLLAQKGAAVVVADIRADAAEAVAQGIRAEGGRASAVATDVGDPASCLACAAAATEAFGRIDYLVNNAGLLSASFAAPLPELAIEDYLRILAVNTHSVLYMTQAVVPAMKAAGGGAIVNTSSIGSWMKTGIYSVSKAGVNALTLNLSQALAPHGIRVNAIAPGTTATEGMQPIMSVEQMGQWAQMLGKPTSEVATPEMIARAGIFLLSDDAHYINGQILPVDGGTIVRL